LLPTGRLEGFSDGVFAIAITLLVIELHVPAGHLVSGLEHEWPRYLGYFVSFAFIGGVWIAHSNMTRFLKAADPDLMRLNLTLLLFVSFLPFTTAIAATHLFVSNLALHDLTVSSTAERVAVVLFGLNLRRSGPCRSGRGEQGSDAYAFTNHIPRVTGVRGDLADAVECRGLR
jgi:uncharacterized membrane protein